MEKIIFGSTENLDGAIGGRRAVVITDRNVERLHAGLTARFECIATEPGERHKTLATVETIYRRLIDMGADRETFILGVGGGVATDLAGFVASTWMRGVAFGFVPTTLLAQVDAAVGGKNGVDVAGFKNMAGTFAAPEFVLCDVGLLSTLPDREMRAGLAEALKAGVVGDPELFALMERRTFARIAGDEALLGEIVRRAVAVKRAIVERDFRESGARRLLNLGHTVGHAVESVSGGRLVHGEAVAVGMAAAARVAVRMGVMEQPEAQRIIGTLEALGLPVSTDLDPRLIADAIRGDKKRSGDGVRFVLPSAIGSCTVRMLGLDEIESMI